MVTATLLFRYIFVTKPVRIGSARLRINALLPLRPGISRRATGRTTDEMRQEVRPVVSLSTPEEQHSNQDKCRGNGIPDKVHPMDALTATKAGVFVIDIKTIPARFHFTNQPRQSVSKESRNWIATSISSFPRGGTTDEIALLANRDRIGKLET